MIKQSVRCFNWSLFIEHIDGYRKSNANEYVMRTVSERRSTKREVTERRPPRSRCFDRDSPRSHSLKLETKSQTVNSDRSRGSNGRKRNLMSVVPPLPHSLIWKHFHGQRVRNHLEPQMANNDTRSFLRKFPQVPSCAQMCAYVHVCLFYVYTRCSGLRAFKPTIRL